MIKRRTRPIRRGVARGAILREIGLLVIRAVSRIVIVLVAVPALAARNAVVAELGVVTLLALQARMRARQRKPGRRMVKRGSAPPWRRRVTRIAGRREARLSVARVIRPIEIHHVALCARATGDAVITEL